MKKAKCTPWLKFRYNTVELVHGDDYGRVFVCGDAVDKLFELKKKDQFRFWFSTERMPQSYYIKIRVEQGMFGLSPQILSPARRGYTDLYSKFQDWLNDNVVPDGVKRIKVYVQCEIR